MVPGVTIQEPKKSKHPTIPHYLVEAYLMYGDADHYEHALVAKFTTSGQYFVKSHDGTIKVGNHIELNNPKHVGASKEQQATELFASDALLRCCLTLELASRTYPNGMGGSDDYENVPNFRIWNQEGQISGNDMMGNPCVESFRVAYIDEAGIRYPCTVEFTPEQQAIIEAYESGKHRHESRW